MKPFFYVAILVFCLSNAWPGYCSDDLLKEMDTLLEAPAPESKAAEAKAATPDPDRSGLRQFADHMELDLTLHGEQYYNGMADKPDQEAEAKLDFRTWAGFGSSSLHIDGWAEYGTRTDTYQGVTPLFRDDSRYRRILEVSQLYWMADLNRTGFALGKKSVPPNTNCIVPLSQVYHPLDLNVPPDARAFGVWQGELDASLGSRTRITARVFPAFQDHKIPSDRSRWMPQDRDQTYWYPNAYLTPEIDFITAFILYYFGDIIQANPFLSSLFDVQALQSAGKTLVMENDRPDTSLDEAGYSGVFKTEFGDLDLFASFFRGPNPFPMIYVEDRGSVVAMVKKNPIVYRTAVGGSVTWRQFEFHTELLYNMAKDDTDDDYLAFTGGITLTDEWTAGMLHLDQVHWRLDYAGETVTSSQDAPGYYFSSKIIRPFTNDLLLHLLLQLNPDTTIYYKMDINFDRDAHFHRVGGSRRLRPGLVLELFSDFFDGNRESFYGQWKDNDRIACQLKWSF